MAVPRRQQRCHPDPARLAPASRAREHLDSVWVSLLCSGVADSTARSYASSQRRYLRFCSLIDSKPLPAAEVDLLRFITDSVSRGLAASTISGVRNLHIINGFENPLEGFQRLRLVLRAIKGEASPRGSDLP